MSGWADLAEELATDAKGELGGAAAELFSSAWRARVDPDALGSLAGAAIALGQRPSVVQPRERGEVLPSDREMRERAEELEADAGDENRAARAMYRDAESTWARACRDLDAARREAREAKSAEARAGAHHAAAKAEAAIADCEVAMEVLAELGTRLVYAIGCLQSVPDDLAVTYEAAYDLRRRGIQLPADGDFLTGTPAQPGLQEATQ